MSTEHHTNTFSGYNIILIPKYECASCDTFGKKSTTITTTTTTTTTTATKIIIISHLLMYLTKAINQYRSATQKPQIKEKVLML
jgi:hypothetical protein